MDYSEKDLGTLKTAIHWAKREAKRRGVGYQAMINEVLLKIAA